jgi:hypothetical protein
VNIFEFVVCFKTALETNTRTARLAVEDPPQEPDSQWRLSPLRAVIPGRKNSGTGMLREQGNTHAHPLAPATHTNPFPSWKVSDSTPLRFFMPRHSKLMASLCKGATVCYKPFTVK